MMMTTILGWISTTILLATLARQVFTLWRDRTTKGVSSWLFIGQLSASAGFIAYSVLLGNVVFVISNTLIAVVSIFGEWVYLRNRRLKPGLDLGVPELPV
jgi:MtN3 and saliva related transmembrane protein